MNESRSKIILSRAKTDSAFQNKLITLGHIRDQCTYFTPEVWMKLAPAMLEFAADAGLLDNSLTQESLDELIEWLMENIDELAYYVTPRDNLSPGKWYQEPVGKVFLSWSVKSPRDRNAILGIKKALEYFNVQYFDYTHHQVDNSEDSSNVIQRQIDDAIQDSQITIEVYSSELGSHWIQYERQGIKSSKVTLRIFVCLEAEKVHFVTTGYPEEKRVVRVDMSGGRIGIVHTEKNEQWMAAATDTSYFQSKEFYFKCYELVYKVRRYLHPIRKTNIITKLGGIFSSRRSRDVYTFLNMATEI